MKKLTELLKVINQSTTKLTFWELLVIAIALINLAFFYSVIFKYLTTK